ncbi:hypothetical protein ABK040_000044 [Willaertia magna]
MTENQQPRFIEVPWITEPIDVNDPKFCDICVLLKNSPCESPYQSFMKNKEDTRMEKKLEDCISENTSTFKERFEILGSKIY